MGPITLCSTDLVLYRGVSESCEHSMFMYQNVSNCPKDAFKLRRPMLKRVGHGWLFSLPRPYQVTLLCRNVTGAVPPATFEINGSGIVERASHCDIISREFKMLSTVHGNITLNESLPNIIRPSFSFNVRHGAGFELLPLEDQPRLQSLKDEIEKTLEISESRLDWSHLVNKVKTLREQDCNWTHFLGYSLGAVLLLAMLAAVLCVVLKLGVVTKRETAPARAALPSTAV
jgi:hypothetical protein